MSYGDTHVERELAGVVARIELLEEIRGQLRGRWVNPGPATEQLANQLDELAGVVESLVKIVKRQQLAIEDLSL